MHIFKVKKQLPRSISVSAGKWQHLRAPWGGTHLLWKPEHSWETLQINWNSNSCVQQGKEKVLQLEYNRFYYPTHKAPSPFFPTMGSVSASIPCSAKLKEPLLGCFLPVGLGFPIHFWLAQILRGALGLWPGERCLQGVHDGIDNDLQSQQCL